jgi:multiple sugar transport system permease protein
MSPSRLGALLVSPTILVLGLVVAYPMLAAIRQSLYGEPGLNPETGFVSDEEPFIGLQNFSAIFGPAAERFWNAFYNTSFFTVTTVLLETVIGVAMALIMHRAMRGRAMVRASILIPWAIPTAASAVLWGWIFNTDGVANAILPGAPILWTTEGFQAQVAVIIAEVWKTAPFIGLLTLAGLQVIPDEVYEAAKMDGATAWRRFWHITLPLVRPALLVAILFRLLDALRMFDLPYILIGPRKDSVETLSMLVHDEATANLDYGAAAAYAVLLFLYVFAVVFAFVGILGADIIGDRDARRKMPLRRRLLARGGNP